MSNWTPRATGPGESAAERAAREERHQVLIELLAAYADGELPPETRSQIDAHLVGCVRCRRDLATHQAVRRRLGVEPPVAAPPALRERIALAIAATPAAERPLPAARHPLSATRRITVVVIAVAAVAAAVGLGVIRDEPTNAPRSGASRHRRRRSR